MRSEWKCVSLFKTTQNIYLIFTVVYFNIILLSFVCLKKKGVKIFPIEQKECFQVKFPCSNLDHYMPLFSFVHRWIKFEEDVEEGGERWSKPHVATLSLHSLFELRACIHNGTVLLDMDAQFFYQVVGKYRTHITGIKLLVNIKHI